RPAWPGAARAAVLPAQAGRQGGDPARAAVPDLASRRGAPPGTHRPAVGPATPATPHPGYPEDPMAVRVPTYRFERELWREGAVRVVGVDEVGVAPTCGAVVAAAVIMKPHA